MHDRDPQNPIPKGVQALFQQWPIVFIGYSLVDYNLRLLLRTLRWGVDHAHVPRNFSVDLNPDVLIKKIWQDQDRIVKFIAQDIWTVVPFLFRRIKNQEMPL